jgi:hypothetical protein
MAKAVKKSEVRSFVKKSRKKLGRHSKKDSPNKNSKNYKKPNAGQGKRQ